MKYRIKIVTYKSGRKEYFAQYKTRLMWVGISYTGEASVSLDGSSDTREQALAKIDKHYSGNTSVQKIEFEYIDK